MKKFLVGLLSVFLIIGGSLLSACGKSETKLELSSQSVEIEINGGEGVSGTIDVAATVSGCDDKTVTVSVDGYENIVTYSTKNYSDGMTTITLKGLGEGSADVVVTTRDRKVSKTIHVEVFSYVNGMSQKEEQSSKKDNFFVRGQDNVLVEDNLIEFSPNKNSRRVLQWAINEEWLATNQADAEKATLEGNIIKITSDFSADQIVLTATTEKGVSCDVAVPVLDPISTNGITLLAGNNLAALNEIQQNEDNEGFEPTSLSIVSNNSASDEYNGYVVVKYTGDLEIIPTIVSLDGKNDADVIKCAAYEKTTIDGIEYPVFNIYTDKDKSAVNGQFKLTFAVGYKDYDYSSEINRPLVINAREVINEIRVTDDNDNVVKTGDSYSVYTQYTASSRGRHFSTQILPTTVLGVDYTYQVQVTLPEGTNLAGFKNSGEDDFSPISLIYRTKSNAYNTITLTKTENDRVFVSEPIFASDVYLKSDDLLTSKIEGVIIEFISYDEQSVRTQFKIDLVKSAGDFDSNLDQVNSETLKTEGDFDFLLNSNERNKSVTKYFKLTGQSTIDGLYVETDSTYVQKPDIVFVKYGVEVENDNPYVIFKVTFTLKDNAYGVTSSGYYNICHENGAKFTANKTLDIFLPLTQASVNYDTSADANSVLFTATSQVGYITSDGEVEETRDDFYSSLESIMLKNGKVTPIKFDFNSTNSNYAKAKITVKYFDKTEENSSEFDSKSIVDVINEATDKSNIVFFDKENKTIRTNSVGFTYVVVSFQGRGVNGQNVTITRVFLVESLETPDKLLITPESDRNVKLIAGDTIGDVDPEEARSQTTKTITINFASDNVTYHNLSNNFSFVGLGDKTGTIAEGKVTWDNDNYRLENVIAESGYLKFDIVAISTKGAYRVFDTFTVHYLLRNGENKVVDMWLPITITIENARRVENVTIKNQTEEELYFTLGQTEGQYILLDVSPSDAKNDTINYILTSESGNKVAESSFVNVSQLSSTQMALTLATTTAMKGSLYLYPADAVYNGNIRYYYVDGEIETYGTIAVDELGKNYDGSYTNFDFLMNEDNYFICYDEQGNVQRLSFSNIIKKIDIVVADGSSFDYAYRIYSPEDFANIQADKFYTVMNSIEISILENFEEFSGGLQGYTEDVTISLLNNSANFAQTLIGTIQNITFTGKVSGQGFVVDTNGGTINNVTVDTIGNQPSELSSTGAVGGIAGTNNGTIENARVLGLNIEGKSSEKVYGVVGGIAGVNNGTITGAKVEFYNLYTGSDYDTNEFTGSIVGGLVGQAGSGSSIANSYVYDYTMSGTDSPLVGTTKGAFVGQQDTGTSTITNSFAVVNIKKAYNAKDEGSSITFTGTYNAYYESSIYTVSYNNATGVTTAPSDLSSEYFITGDDIKGYVNGGLPHLKFYQEEKVTSITGVVQTKYLQNGGAKYYQSCAVDGTKGILFLYEIENKAVSLNASEQKDLDKLNTISLKNLLGEDTGYRVISSNSRIVKVVGRDLKILQTGSVTLTLSSRQDASIKKEISIEVIYAMSDMKISHSGGEVAGSSSISLQRTKSKSFSISFAVTQLYLGNLATQYDLALNQVDLKIATTPNNTTAVTITQSDNVFTATAGESSVVTTVTITPIITGLSGQSGITSKFGRQFTITPIDGAITIEISGDEVSLTPAIGNVVRVQVRSTQVGDTITPIIEGLNVIKSDETTFTFYKTDASGARTNVVQANVACENSTVEKVDGVYTYIFNVSFSICENYQNQIPAGGERLKVSFKTTTENQSDSFDLVLARQPFTSVDINNYKIASVVYVPIGGGYQDKYTIGSKTSVLSPGNSSVLQINVNPDFAYYDYMAISYISVSGGDIAGAVTIEKLNTYGDSKQVFIRDKSSDFGQVGTELRYNPSATRENQLYFKIWINTTVKNDSLIKFTIKFCENDGSESGKELTSANYYLSVSYLKEPTITVDGKDTAFIAKGSSAEIEISVLPEQTIDGLTVSGENVKGISITNLSEPKIDAVKGIKTYTATLYAEVTAGADNNTFSISASVRRVLNGNLETKEAIAKVVIVDFKIDEDNITIEDSENENGEQVLTVWAGVSKSLNVNYSLIPEDYPEGLMDTKEVQDLLKSRKFFTDKGYYPQSQENNDAVKDGASKYLINYYNKNQSGQEPDYRVSPLLSRLYYVGQNNTFIPVTDTNYNSSLLFTEDEGKVLVSGKTLTTETIRMKLDTYIIANGVELVKSTYFTIKIEQFSDPDLPITISSTNEFVALNKDGEASTEITKNDYILTSDIVLESYNPFSTKAISSLDGNGYTIYIKSFDLENKTSTALDLALFTDVLEGTILKNVRVNVYNGGQLTLDVGEFRDIQVAGFALTNSGIITNCEVVAFASDGTYISTTDATTGSSLTKKFTDTLSNDQTPGINIKLIQGAGTEEEQFITKNSSYKLSVAGFVLENNGSITNSRVGGDEIYILGESKAITKTSIQDLGKFSIIAQGDMAGFVLKNSGSIASCYAKNIEMFNKSNTSDFFTAGFVGTNSDSIITSYVEGMKGETQTSAFTKEGTSIKSSLGPIAGFIYENSENGLIRDSYSNILIANSSDSSNVFFVSGFVYQNNGNLKNCYSASQISNSKYTQMNFSGVDANGNLLADGNYENCYFFNSDYTLDFQESDQSTETQYDTGAMIITSPDDADSFYGFAVTRDSNSNDGVWIMNDDGITLIEPNNVSFSHRYIQYIEDGAENNFSTWRENDDGKKYVLPYSKLLLSDGAEIDTALGGVINPILITDEKSFVEAMGTSTSSYVKKYFNDETITGTYRMTRDIDLSKLTVGESAIALPSTTRAFGGRLYGNGFTISNITLTAKDTLVAYGLFKSIEKIDNEPVITNLNISVSQVIAGSTIMAGGLAGYIKNATVINIEINFNEKAEIVANNYAGALAGFAFDDIKIKNINVVNPSVKASYYSSTKDSLNLSKLKDFRGNYQSFSSSISISNSDIKNSELTKYSFAGGVIGYVDAFLSGNQQTGFDYGNFAKSQNFAISNARVSGTVKVLAMNAGGAFGLTANETNIQDVGVIFAGSMANNSSSLQAMYHYAGGVVGQAFGGLNKLFARHDDTIQRQIEEQISKYYSGDTSAERGILNLFNGEGNYQQKAVGGLVGYIGSGVLTNSYSKINATCMTADYAGGIIGVADILGGNYSITLNRSPVDFNSNYLIHEVYATGDVRAKTMAGGIIGQITKDSNLISLFAVNAYNYFTLYDYESGQYGQLGDGETNLSNNYKINSVVGQIENVIASGKETFATYSSKIVFVRGESNKVNDSSTGSTETGDSTGTGSGNGSSADTPGVSVYKDYEFLKGSTSSSAKVYVLGHIDPEIAASTGLDTGTKDKDNNAIMEETKVSIINGPAGFATPSAGRVSTIEGFLNSGIWLNANWKHDMDELFPDIRYKRDNEVLYLDCYNVREVFEAMKNSDATVIVRGYKSKLEQTPQNVDLQVYCDTYGVNWDDLRAIVENFSGVLSGSDKYLINGTKPKIIAPGGFIKSVSEGVSFKDLTIEYTGGNDNDKKITVINTSAGSNGVLVDGSINGGSISNVVIELDAPLVITHSSAQNVGIVAGSITNTQIANLIIRTTDKFPTNLKYIIRIDRKDSSAYAEIKNVGVVCGTLQQTSDVATMNVTGVKIEAGKTQDTTSPNKGALLISSSANYTGTVYIGGYFGSVKRDEGKLPLNLTLKFNTNVDSSSTSQAISLTGTGSTNATIYVGGLIGKADDLSLLSAYDGDDIALNINVSVQTENLYAGLLAGELANYTGGSIGVGNVTGRLTLNKQTDNLVAGGVFGQTDSSSSVNITASSKALNFTIDSQATITNAYTGGMIGNTNTGSVQVSGFKTIQYNFYKTTESSASSVKSSASVSAGNFGGVIGSSQGGGFKYQADDNGTEITGSILVTGVTGNACIGSVAGWIKEGNAEFMVNGKITATPTFATTGGNSLIGGIVGSCAATKIAIGAQDNKNTLQDDADTQIVFDGNVDVSSANGENYVYFGGMIGKASDSTTIYTHNTSFGGVIKVIPKESNDTSVYAGGVAGYIEGVAGYIKNVDSVTINNSYNYGDVFVEYAGTETLKEYCFGGLVGMYSQSDTAISASSNYSLMSSHNAKYSTATTETAHALIGAGSIAQGNKATNYYNHKVVLLTDNEGIDAGYTVAYSKDYTGYGDDCSQGITLVDKIIKWRLGDKVTEEEKNSNFKSGHKLNPNTINSSDKLESNPFNGLTYYTLSTSSKYSAPLNNNKAITSSAIIYESNLPVKFTSNNASHNGFISALSEYSYVSGLVLEVNRTVDGVTGFIAGMVASLGRNCVIYASQVTGNLSAGGTELFNMAGIAKILPGSKIYDCSTDMTLLYRGKASYVDESNTAHNAHNAHIAGIVFTDSLENDIYNGLVENCYSGGRVSCYSRAVLWGIGGWKGAKINDCYTFAQLDYNDYTQLNSSNTCIPVSESEENSNVLYDSDAIIPNAAVGTGVTGGTISVATNGKLKCGDNEVSCSFTDWTQDDAYNYGYPTLKYGYLKTSSYSHVAKQSDVEMQDGRKGDAAKTGPATANYDSYVAKITYTRNANGSKPSEDTNGNIYHFYMIPNATVLHNVKNLYNKNKNYILTNDIDLTNPSSKSGTGVENFQGIFDGCGYTIKGLTSSLFGQVTGSVSGTLTITDNNGEPANTGATVAVSDGAYTITANGVTYSSGIVQNLRLTDAQLKAGAKNDDTYNGGLLASKIENGFVSNMTLSGNIGIGIIEAGRQENITIGGLAKTLDSSQIACVTNLTMISGRGDSNSPSQGENRNVHIGGIAGHIKNSKINYCSNYGPINATANGSDLAVIAGGIAGYESGDSSIQFSYNATSVLSGYAWPGASALDDADCQYFSAGIVGKADGNLNINNCYNSGMIKAGNKSQTSGAYAAGILAYAGENSAITIKNCYNEGPIEALGVNPTYKITTSTNRDTHTLKLIETTESRKVYAYGILGYGLATIEKCGNNSSDVNNNGALGRGDIAKCNIIKYNFSISSKGGSGSDGLGAIGDDWESFDDGNTFSARVTYTRHSSINSTYGVLSENKYGLPTRIVANTESTVTINIHRNEIEDGHWKAQAETTKTYNDAIDCDFNFNYVDGYDNLIALKTPSQEGCDSSSIKQSCRSAQIATDSVVKISNQDYYLAKANNIDIYLSGAYVTADVIQVVEIPYHEEYTYQLQLNTEGVYLMGEPSYQEGEYDDNGQKKHGTQVSFKIMKPGEKPTDGTNVDFTVTASFKESNDFDTSYWDYVYTNDYSFGIKGIEVTTEDEITTGLTPIRDVSTLKNGSSKDISSIYNYVYEIFADENFTTPIYLLKEDIGSEAFVYVPNLQLNGNKVNIYDNWSFSADNVQQIINENFNGKTLYAKGTITELVAFGSESFEGLGTHQAIAIPHDELSYGYSASGAMNEVTGITNTGYVSANYGGGYYYYGIEWGYLNPQEGAVAVDENGVAIFRYEYDADTGIGWQIVSNTIVCNGKLYNVKYGYRYNSDIYILEITPIKGYIDYNTTSENSAFENYVNNIKIYDWQEGKTFQARTINIPKIELSNGDVVTADIDIEVPTGFMVTEDTDSFTISADENIEPESQRTGFVSKINVLNTENDYFVNIKSDYFKDNGGNYVSLNATYYGNSYSIDTNYASKINYLDINFYSSLSISADDLTDTTSDYYDATGYIDLMLTKGENKYHIYGYLFNKNDDGTISLGELSLSSDDSGASLSDVIKACELNSKIYLGISEGYTVSSFYMEKNLNIEDIPKISVKFPAYRSEEWDYGENLGDEISYSVKPKPNGITTITETTGETNTNEKILAFLSDTTKTSFTVTNQYTRVPENITYIVDSNSWKQGTSQFKGSIILTQDVSLNNGSPIVTKPAGMSINGNGYYISFYGGALYTSIRTNWAETDYFKDLLLLGETDTYFLPNAYKQLIFVPWDSTMQLHNLTLYGRNIGGNSVLVSTSSKDAITITSYVNVTQVGDISLTGENVLVNNYGTIIGRDGKDATESTYATPGASIAFVSGSTNHGVVKAGDGGNGWVRNKTLNSASLTRSRQATASGGKKQVSVVTLDHDYTDGKYYPLAYSGSVSNLVNSSYIESNNGKSFTQIDDNNIFNVGALLLGYRYDYGINDTYAEPLIMLFKPAFNSGRVSVWDEDHKKQSDVTWDNGKGYNQISNIINSASGKDVPYNCYKFDIMDYVFNYIIKAVDWPEEWDKKLALES